MAVERTFLTVGRIDQTESTIRLLVCSKYRVLRAALRLLIETDARINVVGEADSASAIVGLAQAARADLILLDDDLCDAGPDALWNALQSSAPTARVLLLHDARKTISPETLARNQGLGVVSKEDTPEALLEAIRKVHTGEPVLSESSHSDAIPSTCLRPPFDLPSDDATQRLPTAGTPIHRMTVSDRRVLAVLETVASNLQKSDSIEVLARRVGIGGSRLRHLLRDLVGMSLSRFRTECRLQVAARLLAHSHKRVSEIAYQVGFSDLAYFDKVFRKRFGVSPTRYRRLNSHSAWPLVERGS
jgi:AraC-like DNA-binding protein